MRPCLPTRFAAAYHVAGCTASASLPISLPTTQIGTYRYALPTDFTRLPAGWPLLFSLHQLLLYYTIKPAFQPFQFSNRKGKARCAAVKGL